MLCMNGANRVTDIFISYSRNNAEFANKLADALENIGLDIWIDKTSIRNSVEWWFAIEKGILEANNFLIIMSPDSMASPICHLEIEYAINKNKRIIPINYLEFERQEAIMQMVSRLASLDTQDYVLEIWGARRETSVFDYNGAVA